MSLKSPVCRDLPAAADLPWFEAPRFPPVVKAETPRPLYRARREYRKVLVSLRPRCTFCGSGVKLGTSTLDHLVPLSRGGKDRPSNLVLCCRNCNSAKGDRTPLRWALSIVLAAGRHRLAAMIRG